MSVISPETSLQRLRPLGLALLIATLVALAVALALRTLALDRAAQERLAEAGALARLALDAQQSGAALQLALMRQARDAALRGGPDAGGNDAAERELLADAFARSLKPFDALPLTTQEHLQLAMIRESVRAVRPLDPRPVTLDALDQNLDRLLAAAGARIEGLVRNAEADRRIAGLTLLAFATAALALVCGLLVQAYRTRYANRELLARMSQLTQEDPLTGIVNRRGLDAALPVELARARRSGQPLTAVMIDLDYFKKYNDRRGHAAGDALLRGAAQSWARQLRPTDRIARYGGEEFTLVLPGCDADQAALLVSRLRPLVPERQTFSAGIATWDERETESELLQRADLALAQAKKAGRNRTMIAGREPQATLPLQVA